MTAGDEVFRQIQRTARSIAAKEGRRAPTAELLTRHAMESFLDRLTRTDHGQDFVLKGGVLLAVYGFRRSTRDVDAEAIRADVTPEHIRRVMRDVADVPAGDGLVFDLGTLHVEEIREGAHYPGLRMRITTRLSTQNMVVTWDISCGDPIIPEPRRIRLPRVIGEAIEMWGYAPETVIAEKAVTILERGIASTRWRDYVDIVQLAAAANPDGDTLARAAEAVARYRGVELQPIAGVVSGYGAVSQAKWAAWRRKEGLEGVCEERLDDQMAKVAKIVDPVFSRGLRP